eukprot:2402753-Amphidinium_carterae.1
MEIKHVGAPAGQGSDVTVFRPAKRQRVQGALCQAWLHSLGTQYTVESTAEVLATRRPRLVIRTQTCCCSC